MTQRSPEIVLELGDITQQAVDAIVNAGNSELILGTGVAGAIRERGGPSIQAELDDLRKNRLPEGLPTGGAVATTAGKLPARWVIHTAGPIYTGASSESELLAACQVSCLGVADELGAKTIAFPAISTGVYGYPVHRAASIAIGAVRRTRTSVKEVRFVLFDSQSYRFFSEALGRSG
ncbi:MAG: O-acetyl-ADP-ribose deacetylase [Actinomycetota bacterium]|jgi:O-acetyl-ADP-ribose deacetylase (regulator of RNase III)|nr:O-acetyl-ADP-ribose deacetylase [Actinomycetota bacterium]